ncbi:LEAF RUST 10 DISEASE-RESISTANCE LOCUS RECEPTOR-LIKE PROTEIN KINASE-like 2.1 isoform X1 [Zingiber officinale]|uniref:LEAF RUST 10 DISEASE-RESISTANCE LOCUS RECEPTOR-LIKE PROTEIN KINASE-like 2.1 isoform X1 n=1 Tax=Zingiber officinale TaxID=94328 RepID=UPI001C4DBFEF|nr:LEAF RUST 10 DISEASE-RESISTANCE LOCUS RECEPTOR-LIKE PROTEIN KINASE-like 2.1 isoform X1 [Zingiber officinale]
MASHCIYILGFLLNSLLLIQASPLSETDILLYDRCGKRKFDCGNSSVDVSYPFLTLDSPDACGHPTFVLNCNPSQSSITILVGNTTYQVIDAINYSDQSLTLADRSFFDEPCVRPSHNTTFDRSLFNYTTLDDLQVTFFFNCSAANTSRQLFSSTCAAAYGGPVYYWPNTSLPGRSSACGSSVVVRMDRTTVDRMKAREINYAQALRVGFRVGWTGVVSQNCRNCIHSGGVCGHNNSMQVCFCSNGLAADGACNPPKGTPTTWRILQVLFVGATGCVTCLLLFHTYRQTKNGTGRNTQSIEDIFDAYGSLAPRRYKYSDMKKLTNCFREKLGKGGYGTVYKGKLEDGRLVAVKVLKKSQENGADFINEVASIGRTSHVNVVSLLGYSHDGHRRALVYEYMANGSLDKYIYSDNPKALLAWDKLYQIAHGIARGLEYLHQDCNTRIVHFDIKPHNILLDEEFCPKISDFGLAKLCPHKRSAISMADARGTIGYIAPEVFSRNFGVVSTKSDVYSYGTMVLEMVGGRKNVKAHLDESSEVYFPHWVYEHLDQGEDLKPLGVTPETEEIAKKMILVGLWCIQIPPKDRPSISRVVEMLEGRTSEMEMPPKPCFSSIGRSVDQLPLQTFSDSSLMLCE